MPDWVAGQPAELGIVVAKALLMYLTVLVGLRLAHRRTLSQWTAIDFAAAVAVGAILGRTSVATGQPFLVGAVALVTILAAHTVASYARFSPVLAKGVDHRVRVLVDHGRLRHDQMRLCGLTENDVFSQLRRQGVGSIGDLRYVMYETKGELTVVRETDPARPDTEMVRQGLHTAAGYPPKR